MSTHELNLEIKNFQIIKKAEFKFEKGINLIVGQSANGKSSILRSIKTALLNSSGSQKFIKHGTDSTSVLMVYNDNIIEWKRTKTGSKYIINGKEYSKLGTSNITKILDNSGFVIDYKNDILNLEGAWQILFPFDKSDAELFKLFENIFCVSDSGKIFQSFKVEEDRIEKELQEYNVNFNKNKLKIEAIEKLQEEVNINKLKEYKEKLTNYNKQQNDLTLDIRLLTSIDSFLSIVPKECKIKIFKTDNLLKYKEISNDMHVLKEIKNYPLIKKDSLKSFNKDLINNYSILKEDIDNIKRVKNYPLIEEKNKKVFDNSLILEYNKIKESLNSLDNLKIELKKLKIKKDSIEEELTIVQEKLSEYKTCEYCGNIIE